MLTQSLVEAISDAVDRRKVPAFRPGDIRDLAIKLGLVFPVAVSTIIRTLANLPPAVVTIDITEVETPGGVSAVGQVGLQTDGDASLRGWVTNPNAGQGINYVYAVALLDIKDDSGKVVTFSKSGNLFNLIQASNDTFQEDVSTEYIAKNWDIAKKTRSHAVIIASDNILEDTAAIVGEALLVVATAGVIMIIPGGDGAPPRCVIGTRPRAAQTSPREPVEPCSAVTG
jgi:hypothetical protein